jgi:hypothetical protein
MNQSETLQVDVETRGCFHGSSAKIEVVVGEDHCNLSVSRNHGPGTIILAELERVSVKRGRKIIDHFLGLLGTPQRLSGDRSTTVYDCRVAWRLGESKSNWSLHTSELPACVVDEILQSDMDSEMKRKIEKSRIGYFNLGHELFSAAMKVADDYESEHSDRLQQAEQDGAGQPATRSESR